MTIELNIDDKLTDVAEGTSIFEAAENIEVYIPTSCLKNGKCRECLVEVLEGARAPVLHAAPLVLEDDAARGRRPHAAGRHAALALSVEEADDVERAVRVGSLHAGEPPVRACEDGVGPVASGGRTRGPVFVEDVSS